MGGVKWMGLAGYLCLDFTLGYKLKCLCLVQGVATRLEPLNISLEQIITKFKLVIHQTTLIHTRDTCTIQQLLMISGFARF